MPQSAIIFSWGEVTNYYDKWVFDSNYSVSVQYFL